MKYSYRLQICFDASIETNDRLSALFNINSADNYHANKIPSEWNYQVVQNEDDDYFDFISVFADMIEPNYEILLSMGIKYADITFWLLYEYENQCNMEFTPHQLKRLGSIGVVFCISCWEKDSNLTLE